jgi:hypothetical protein
MKLNYQEQRELKIAQFFERSRVIRQADSLPNSLLFPIVVLRDGEEVRTTEIKREIKIKGRESGVLPRVKPIKEEIRIKAA